MYMGYNDHFIINLALIKTAIILLGFLPFWAAATLFAYYNCDFY